MLVFGATYDCFRVALGATSNKPLRANWNCPRLGLGVPSYFLYFGTHLNVVDTFNFSLYMNFENFNYMLTRT
jgi:hypothetical protein